MKKFILMLLSAIAFILITCQNEDTMVFNDEIEPVKHEVESTDTQYLLDLIATIEGLVPDEINAGNANALISKIENTIKSIEKGNTNAVTGQLGSFINSTEALVNSGTLTEELGQTLIEPAEEAIMLADGVFVDPRGEEYTIVKIGGQIWMAENLAYLPEVSPPNVSSYEDPLYYVYGYTGTNVDEALNTQNYNTYGVLYNWPAAKEACPTGWHLPSDAEWTTLTNSLGGVNIAGSKLKDIGNLTDGTGLWLYNDGTEGTNTSGFTGLPGGNHYIDSFGAIGLGGYWWSNTPYGSTRAWKMHLYYHTTIAHRSNSTVFTGLSVRCVKD